MERKSSPPPGMVILDVDAETAMMEDENERDRQVIADLSERMTGLSKQIADLLEQIARREENARFLHVIRSRVVDGVIMMTVSDSGAPPDDAAYDGRGRSKTTGLNTGPKLTQKFRSLAVMDEAGNEGLMAIEIINNSMKRFPTGKKIERTSLSPLLAKMAASEDGDPLVTHHKDVNRWSITDAGREELKRLRGNVG